MKARNYDPYFTSARFNSVCPETGKQIKKGERIAYFPKDKKAYHQDSKAAEDIRQLQFAESWNMADANW